MLPRIVCLMVSVRQRGYTVLLDGRQLKTPNGQPLVVPSETLAELLAYEWDTQEEILARESMHLTSLCNTAVDNPRDRSDATKAAELMEYFSTDTLRFRVPYPTRVVKQMESSWDPLVSWFEDFIGHPVSSTHAALHVPPHTSHRKGDSGGGEEVAFSLCEGVHGRTIFP